MSKGRWRIIGYDGAGEPIKRRKHTGRDPERQRRERPSVRSLARGFARVEAETENLDIARSLGLRVR